MDISIHMRVAAVPAGRRTLSSPLYPRGEPARFGISPARKPHSTREFSGIVVIKDAVAGTKIVYIRFDLDMLQDLGKRMPKGISHQYRAFFVVYVVRQPSTLEVMRRLVRCEYTTDEERRLCWVYEGDAVPAWLAHPRDFPSSLAETYLTSAEAEQGS